VTGTFGGKWALAAAPTGAAAPTLSPPPISPFPKGGGGVIMFQLVSTPTAIDGVHDVRGEMVLRDGEFLSPNDVHLGIEGSYITRLGQLRAVVSRAGLSSGVTNSPTEPSHGWLIEPAGVRMPDAAAAAAATRAAMARERSEARGRAAARGKEAKPIPLSECPLTLSAQFAPSRRGTGGSSGEGKGSQQLVVETAALASEMCTFAAEVTAEEASLEQYFRRAMSYTVMVMVANMLQVGLLVRQMARTASPAAARHVSVLCIGNLALIDAFECMLHLTAGMVIESLLATFGSLAFFKFITFSVLEMRYVLTVWKAQRPSGFSVTDGAARHELGMLYVRFYALLCLSIFLLFKGERYAHYAIFASYSFWVPQIVRSAVLDARRPLNKGFIVGTSVTRLIAPLYYFGYKANFLNVRPNPAFCAALCAWVGAQTAVLLLQHTLGARFFVPRAFLPAKYDYFQNVTPKILNAARDGVDLEAGGGTTDPAAGDKPATDQKDPSVECAICFLPVDLSDRRLGRRIDRVITPCDHVFHEECLSRWMDVKQECPVCRGELPSL